MVSLGGIYRLSPERQRGMYTKYSDRYAWTISVDPDPTSRSVAIDQALTVCYLSSRFFFYQKRRVLSDKNGKEIVCPFV